MLCRFDRLPVVLVIVMALLLAAPAYARAQTPPAKAAPPTAQRIQKATVKLIGAAALHAVAQEKADKPNPSLADVLAAGVALEVRNGLVKSALSDLFPGLTDRQAGDLQLLMMKVLDGKLDFGKGDQQAAKQRLIDDLRASHPALGQAGVIVDFVYSLYQGLKQR